MASIGTPLRDDELVSYVLGGGGGLDQDYNSIYSVITARISEPITPRELYAQLLGFEQHFSYKTAALLGSPRVPTQHRADVVCRAAAQEAILRSRSWAFSWWCFLWQLQQQSV
jgi:hypothetical protein